MQDVRLRRLVRTGAGLGDQPPSIHLGLPER